MHTTDIDTCKKAIYFNVLRFMNSLMSNCILLYKIKRQNDHDILNMKHNAFC